MLAFRDRGAGTQRNHARSTEVNAPDVARGGAAARVRGGKLSPLDCTWMTTLSPRYAMYLGYGRFPANTKPQAVAPATLATVMTVTPGRDPMGKDDPRSASRYGPYTNMKPSGSEKQAAASWGAQEGEAELKDEQAGEAIAKTDEKEAAAEDAAAEDQEPEDKSVSYADYLVQQAEKKLALEDSLKIRTANEGSKLDKKWQGAKPLEKEETDYFSATSGKKQREREKKVKQTVDFDPRFVEPERPHGGRGGRGGPRGGARGGRGGRGGERGAPRGNFRGGRGGRETAAPINTRDESAFPSLGGK